LRRDVSFVSLFHELIMIKCLHPLRSRRSQRSSVPNIHHNNESELAIDTVAKHHVSVGNTRRLQRESEDDETPQRAIFASEEAHREPAESVVYYRSGILCRSLNQL